MASANPETKATVVQTRSGFELLVSAGQRGFSSFLWRLLFCAGVPVLLPLVGLAQPGTSDRRLQEGPAHSPP